MRPCRSCWRIDRGSPRWRLAPGQLRLRTSLAPRGMQERPSSLWLEAGVLDHLPGDRAILLDLFGELFRRIDRRRQAAGGEMALAEGGIIDDARHFLGELVDDRLGRSGRHEQSVPAAR